MQILVKRISATEVALEAKGKRLVLDSRAKSKHVPPLRKFVGDECKKWHLIEPGEEYTPIEYWTDHLAFDGLSKFVNDWIKEVTNEDE